MTYYDATDLIEIAKVTGKKVYVTDGKNIKGFIEDIEPKALFGYLFCELEEDDDTYGYYVKVTYWDKVFEYNDDGYYNVGYTPVYGAWGIDEEIAERIDDPDEGDVYEEYKDWEIEDINEITV